MNQKIQHSVGTPPSHGPSWMLTGDFSLHPWTGNRLLEAIKEGKVVHGEEIFQTNSSPDRPGGPTVGGKGPKSSKADEWSNESNESNGYLGRFFSVFQSFLMKFIKSPHRQNSLAEASLIMKGPFVEHEGPRKRLHSKFKSMIRNSGFSVSPMVRLEIWKQQTKDMLVVRCSI